MSVDSLSYDVMLSKDFTKKRKAWIDGEMIISGKSITLRQIEEPVKVLYTGAVDAQTLIKLQSLESDVRVSSWLVQVSGPSSRSSITSSNGVEFTNISQKMSNKLVQPFRVPRPVTSVHEIPNPLLTTQTISIRTDTPVQHKVNVNLSVQSNRNNNRVVNSGYYGSSATVPVGSKKNDWFSVPNDYRFLPRNCLLSVSFPSYIRLSLMKNSTVIDSLFAASRKVLVLD